MLHELQQKKLTHLFKVFDINKNGALEKQDFITIANRLSLERGWPDPSPEAAFLNYNYVSLFDNISNFADLNDDGVVSEKEWLAWHEAVLNNKDLFKALILNMGNLIFDLCDGDNNNSISLVEYSQFFAAHNLNGSEAEKVFNKLDIDGNGVLSRDEVVSNMKEFYYSLNNTCPGNFMMGFYN